MGNDSAEWKGKTSLQRRSDKGKMDAGWERTFGRGAAHIEAGGEPVMFKMGERVVCLESGCAGVIGMVRLGTVMLVWDGERHYSHRDIRSLEHSREPLEELPPDGSRVRCPSSGRSGTVREGTGVAYWISAGDDWFCRDGIVLARCGATEVIDDYDE